MPQVEVEVLRWRDFGPARLDRHTPQQRHPPVDPRTGRELDSFQPNAASRRSARRPPLIPFEERWIIWALPTRRIGRPGPNL